MQRLREVRFNIVNLHGQRLQMRRIFLDHGPRAFPFVLDVRRDALRTRL